MKAIEVLKEYTVYLKENLNKKDIGQKNNVPDLKNAKTEIN